MGLELGFMALPSFDGWKPDIRANYGGSDRKAGLIGPDGTRYMVKYSEKQAPRNDLATSYVNNVISEHVSSRILGILGYPVHETALGTLGGEAVVACRNFVPPGGELIEFEKFMRRHYDSRDIGRLPDINQIYEIIETDPVLSAQSDVFKAGYWTCFVGDALVGNFDRHKGNFGYLIGADDSVSASPIYDNGSTLYPNLSEQGMKDVLASPKEIMMRVRLFPKAALEMNGKKVGCYDMMASGIYDELTRAVASMVPRIRDSMPAVLDFINGCSFLSDTRKDFYSVMLAERMAFLLEPAYRQCASRRFDLGARNRLMSGAGYSEADFDDYWKIAQYADGRDAVDIRDRVIGGREGRVPPLR